MKNKINKESMKKQSFNYMLSIIAIIFLMIAYTSFMKGNYTKITRLMGVVITLSILPLDVYLISDYALNKSNRINSNLNKLKLLINIINPITIYYITNYLFYYISLENPSSLKLNMITVIFSTVVTIFTNSIAGILFLQLPNLMILNLSSNVNYGYNAYTFFAIIYLIFSLVFAINYFIKDIEKNEKIKKEKIKEKTNIKEKSSKEALTDFTKICLDSIIAMFLLIIVVGILELLQVRTELINGITIILFLNIFNASYIKKKFPNFSKIYTVLYEAVLLYSIVFYTNVENIWCFSYATYTNLLLLVVSYYFSIGKNKEKDKNNELITFTLQVFLYISVLLHENIVTYFITQVIYSVIVGYLLKNAFERNETYKYPIYIIIGLGLWIYVKLLYTYNYSNIENLIYIFSGISLFLFTRKKYLKKEKSA